MNDIQTISSSLSTAFYELSFVLDEILIKLIFEPKVVNN